MEHENQGMNWAPYIRSVMVFVALSVLTALEYWVATTDDLESIFSSNLAPLAVIAVLKSGLIVYYYMHITSLWSDEEEGH